MIYPDIFQYFCAVQNPDTAFPSKNLQCCTVESNYLGPISWNGSFATIYHLKNSSNEYAIRCFIQKVEDIQNRYEAIDKMLKEINHDFFVKTKYLKKGIKVGSDVFEVIKMDWVKGVTLDKYIGMYYNDNYKIQNLLDSFIDMIFKLEDAGISHGDLQHGNILITDEEKIKLVDYDGMYVPEKYCSNVLKTSESGHPNYQHPQRLVKSYFNEFSDRFSSISIYLSIRSIFEFNNNVKVQNNNPINLPPVQRPAPVSKNKYVYLKSMSIIGLFISIFFEFFIVLNITPDNRSAIGSLMFISFLTILGLFSLIGFLIDFSVSDTGIKNKTVPVIPVPAKNHIWDNFNVKENLIFTEKDYLYPDNSKLFGILLNISGLNREIQEFIKICKGNIEDVPSLKEFLRNFSEIKKTKQENKEESKSSKGIPEFNLNDYNPSL